MESIDKLKEKVDKDPNSTLFVPLAEEYRKAGQLDEAIGVLVSGIERQPGYTSAKVALGKIYIVKDMQQEARKVFEQVVTSAPDNIFAQKKLAEIYKQAGDRDMAIEQYRKLIAMNPKDEAAQSELFDLEVRGGGEAKPVAPEQPDKQEMFTKAGEPAQPSAMPSLAPEEDHLGVMPPADTLSAGALNIEEEMKSFSASLTDKDDTRQHGDESVGFQASLSDKMSEPTAHAAETGGAGISPVSPMAQDAHAGAAVMDAAGGMDEEAASGAAAVGIEEVDSADAIELDIDEAMSLGDIVAEATGGEAMAGELPILPEEEAAVPAPDEAHIKPSAYSQPEPSQLAALTGEADFAVATENYVRAASIYREILGKDPNNNDVRQRASELRMLLKMIGKDGEVIVAQLDGFLEGLNRRKNEFFGNS